MTSTDTQLKPPFLMPKADVESFEDLLSLETKIRAAKLVKDSFSPSATSAPCAKIVVGACFDAVASRLR
jgi:hypothetical protein